MADRRGEKNEEPKAFDEVRPYGGCPCPRAGAWRGVAYYYFTSDDSKRPDLFH
jgi:hypothetical protein